MANLETQRIDTTVLAEGRQLVMGPVRQRCESIAGYLRYHQLMFSPDNLSTLSTHLESRASATNRVDRGSPMEPEPHYSTSASLVEKQLRVFHFPAVYSSPSTCPSYNSSTKFTRSIPEANFRYHGAMSHITPWADRPLEIRQQIIAHVISSAIINKRKDPSSTIHPLTQVGYAFGVEDCINPLERAIALLRSRERCAERELSNLNQTYEEVRKLGYESGEHLSVVVDKWCREGRLSWMAARRKGLQDVMQRVKDRKVSCGYGDAAMQWCKLI